MTAPTNTTFVAGTTITSAWLNGVNDTVNFTADGVGAVVRDLSEKVRESVSVKDFGAVGDGVTDDTAAIQAAIDRASAYNKALLFPEGTYAVTTITTGSGASVIWHFDNAELKGIASSSTDCIVKIESFMSNFYGMRVNGNLSPNYRCLVWWYNAAAPSQYNNFFGLTLIGLWRGLVYGEFPGSNSNSLAQSENSVFGLQCYGVWQPLVMNHSNGVLFFTGSQFVSGDQLWGGSFDNTQNFAFVAYAGALTISSSEIQNSVAANTSFCAIVQGGEVYLNDCIIETDAPFQVSGKLTINGGRCINTRTDTSQFYIGASAGTTKIKVNDCWLSRVPTSGSYAAIPLVANTGSSTSGIEVEFNNCHIDDWPSFVPLIEANNQNAHFTNCRWYPDGTQNSHSAVYLLDTTSQDLLDVFSIDRKGHTTDGWYANAWYGGTQTLALNADVPNANYLKSLSYTSSGQGAVATIDQTSLSTIKATGFRVSAGDRFIVEGWVKSVSGTSTIGMALYDATGAILADPFLNIASTATIDATWKYVRGVLLIPAGAAAYAGFCAATLVGEVRVCGLKARRASWNMQ